MGEGQQRVQGVECGEVVVDDAGEEVGGGGRGGRWTVFVMVSLYTCIINRILQFCRYILH